MTLLKFSAVLFAIIFSAANTLFAQVPGQWTWQSGSKIKNYPGHFGIQGVPDPANYPPALYEAGEWTDLKGNFWIYGGGSYNAFKNDLWKYDPVSGLWTWVNGNNSKDTVAIHGTMGIPSRDNSPGARTFPYTWVDLTGQLWLFGGWGCDLWRYNIDSGMWTWMKGGIGCPLYPHYGIKGVEDLLNSPPSNNELSVNWVDNDGNFWLLDNKGCLWKYRMETNNWIWMKGDTTGVYPSPVYGSKGVPSMDNTPGANFFNFTKWKDSYGKLWFLDTYVMNLWNYDVTTNMWTWMYGDGAASYGPQNYNAGTCASFEESAGIIPYWRGETRACWIDKCDNLWLMGGASNYLLNDLLYYSTRQNKWVWVDNDTVKSIISIYGTKGVPGPKNRPASRCGAMPFTDLAGNLWVFGGGTDVGDFVLGDLWMYTIDTSCTKCQPTSIKNNEKVVQDVTVYPNPASSEFTIDVGTQNIDHLIIFNSIGAKIMEMHLSTGQTKISMLGYSKGLYYAQIILQNKDVINKKIILN